jgi:alpha-tubulin suppressor-like RCC1 family protein
MSTSPSISLVWLLGGDLNQANLSQRLISLSSLSSPKPPAALRSLPALWLAGLLVCLSGLIGCGDSAAPIKPGEIMLVFESDLNLPNDIDELEVRIYAGSELRYRQKYPLGEQAIKLPATLGVIANEPRATRRFVAIGYKLAKPKVVREAIATIPGDYIAQLRLPLNYLCLDKVVVEEGEIRGTCPSGETCVEGACASSTQLELPEFIPNPPPSKTTPACFSLSECFSQALDLSPNIDQTTCSTTLSEPGVPINLAMRLPLGSGGLCDDFACYVMLDPQTSWEKTDANITFSPQICSQIQELGAQVLLSTTCPAKPATQPLCSPWSSVGNTSDVSPGIIPINYQLTAGRFHACRLRPNGRIKCWGYNQGGELCTGDTSNHGNSDDMGDLLPHAALGKTPPVTRIFTGESVSCALFLDGQAKCWGGSPDYRVHGDPNHQYLGGELSASGDNIPFLNFGNQEPLANLGIGALHACGITVDGRLKCWGNNANGELGLGDTNDRNAGPSTVPYVNLGAGVTPLQVCSGYRHTCVLLSGNHVRCWGNGFAGQLGSEMGTDLGDTPATTPDRIADVNLGTDQIIKQLECNFDHNCVVFDSGQVKCWGSNDSGKLGLGNLQTRGNSPGEMGIDLPYVELGTNARVLQISNGYNHTCAVLQNGELKCWGRNDSGQLGLGDTINRGELPGQMADALPSVNLGTGLRARAVSAGGNFTCALLTDQRIKCWGENVSGQLGVGDPNDRGADPNDMGDQLPGVDLGKLIIFN